MEEQRAELATGIGVVDPELVLVLETVGSVQEFMRAVGSIGGFEFLAELDEEGITDEAFALEVDGAIEELDGSLYLMASNQAALSAIAELWTLYQRDGQQKFPRGLTKWRDVFRLLVDIRAWSPADRLRGTGALEDFARRIEVGQDRVPAELELWFRDDEERQAEGESLVRVAVEEAGGVVVAQSLIPEIAYHAVLVDLPARSVAALIESRYDDLDLIRVKELAFVRPEAQALVSVDPSEGESEAGAVAYPAPTDDAPLVAVLDGLPLAEHERLAGRLVIDDPDGWSADVPAAGRQHGTAMAGIVLSGDASAGEAPVARRIYVRPVLKPAAPGIECIPAGELAVDLVYRAIVRMMDGAGAAVADEVRLVNLSIGDVGSQLSTTMSPWARLLDYLAVTYDLLFVVSAGNHAGRLELDVAQVTLGALSDEEVRSLTLNALANQAHQRRILSPAEAVSALCVGSSHEDQSGPVVMGSRHDLLPGSGSGVEALPSPMSAVGMGYKRSIKPDLLAPGGRVLYRVDPQASGPVSTVFVSANGAQAPGVRVPTPSRLPGRLDAIKFAQGTSVAAALVSHRGAQILEHLASLSDTDLGEVDPDYWAVLTKTLLVHRCGLGVSSDEVRAMYLDLEDMRRKDSVSRFFGNGILDAESVLGAQPARATAIGWGSLEDGEGERFEFPLPPSLSGSVVTRRLTITAAYFPPIRLRDRRHRAAEIYVRPDRDSLRVSRVGADWRTVKRGSVQHETMSGAEAAAYVDGHVLNVQVNCRSIGRAFTGAVRFGLAVSLEAAGGLPIHAEVSTRIRARAQARV